MMIVVADACIFIDLFENQLTSNFFSLPFEIITTPFVLNELYPQQSEILKAAESTGNLKMSNTINTPSMHIPISLTETDKSVILTAIHLKAFILSSDKVIRNFSERNGISCHGLLWILDQMVKSKKVSSKLAQKKLENLFKVNLFYRNNPFLQKEAIKMVKSWEKQDIC